MKITKDRIIKGAIELAEKVGWSQSTLLPLADHLGCTVPDIRQHFGDANEIAGAYFEQALDHMLGPTPDDFAEKPVIDRLEYLYMRWFEFLEPHRDAAKQMMAAKLHPPHVHHWLPCIFHTSRHVQLLRDAALLRAGGRRQQIEEIGLTAILLATIRFWYKAPCTDLERTRNFLHARLLWADRNVLKLYKYCNL